MREQLGKDFAEPFIDFLNTSGFIASVTEEYYKANNRWPEDFEELAIFWEKLDSEARSKIREQRIGRGSLEGMDMDMNEDISFSPQDDGSLKVEIVRELPRADTGTEKFRATYEFTVTIPTPSDAPCDEETGTKVGSSTKTKRESLNPAKINRNR